MEECLALDVTVLQRQGVFDQWLGQPWSSGWKTGEEIVARIGYQLMEQLGQPYALRLFYSLSGPDGFKTDYDYPVDLTRTPCHFGGSRWWFVCSLVIQGRSCGRRVRKLYLPPSGQHFGCRRCCKLTYKSAQEHDKQVDALLRLPPNEIVKSLESSDLKKFLVGLKAYGKLLDYIG